MNPVRGIHRRSVGLLALLAGVCLVASALRAADAPASSFQFAREPYLQHGTPHSMVIVWRTLGPIVPQVKFGMAPDQLDRTVPVTQMRIAISLGTDPVDPDPNVVTLRHPRFSRLPKLHSAPPGTVQYEATVTGLDPAARYYYAVYDGEKRLTPADPSYSFRTHPVVGQAAPVRFWLVGDSGTGRDAQAHASQAMLNYLAREKLELDFYVHVGDMAYSDGKDLEFQRGFFNVYASVLRNVVCWPAMGNHEGHTSRGTDGVGPYYDAYVLPSRGEAGGLPSGTEAYYSFDYGRVHFICLDSHDLDRKPTGAMALWLKADLERTRADWIIAFWHHPPYTKGSHDSDTETQLIEMRTHLMPILESGGVDVVLTGHSHIYERSMLMDGAYATPTVAEHVIFDDRDGDPQGDGPYRKSAGIQPNQGTIQVVAGHGGADLGRKGTMPVMRRIIVEHGTALIEVQGDTLTGIMINKDGVERDRFSLVKQGTVNQTRLANPRQEPPYTPPASPRRGDDSETLPDAYLTLIPAKSEWLYLAGTHPSSPDWVQPDFPIDGWKRGLSPFGYGDQLEISTKLDDMRGKYTVVYARREFVLDAPENVTLIGLNIDFDDGFIAYLNGAEILRKNVREGSGREAARVVPRIGTGARFYTFKDFQKHLRPGRNVLAIEGHNREAGSSDFILHPVLIMED